MVDFKCLITSFLHAQKIGRLDSIYLFDIVQSHTSHQLLYCHYGEGTVIDLDSETLFLKVRDFIIH